MLKRVGRILSADKLHISPACDEVEVSVFGPGYGECILIHAGDRNLFILDSCIDPASQQPAVLEYLNKINMSPTDVKLVIATHWHDDHIRGLSKVFKACQNADFTCSDALLATEFKQLVKVYGRQTITKTKTTGVDEFYEIFNELASRKKQLGTRYLPPIFATANRCIKRIYIDSMKCDCAIHSLSPSDAAILASKLDIQKLFPDAEQPKRRLLSSTSNKAAVVLWISIGKLNILLGSDLEESGDSQTGWAVITGSSARPQGRASIFKIPHHGSKNAHHSGIWSDLLIDKPIAVLTPYSRGSYRLPTNDDISRISSLTEQAYATSSFSALSKSMKKRDSTVDKIIRELGYKIRQINNSIGHVRLRTKQGNPWSIELFGDALPLNKLNVS